MDAAIKLDERFTLGDYYNTREGERVELIHGEFYALASPNRRHQKIAYNLSRIMGNYIEANHGKCEVYPAPFDVQLWADDDTVVVPDISIICDPSKLTKQGCTGAPDLIVEVVSPGNASHDYIRKLQLYNDACVREYWIVDPSNENTIVYKMDCTDDKNFQTNTYPFSARIPVGVLEGLSVCIAELET